MYSSTQGFPGVAEVTVERVQAWLEAGKGALGQIAEDAPLQGWQDARAKGRKQSAATLEAILKDDLGRVRQSFSGLFVLDPDGKLLAAHGNGVELETLRDVLQERTALNSELVEIMHTAKVREELSNVEGPALHVFDPQIRAPIPIAAVPLVSRGKKLGSLHGVYRREGLEAHLRSDRMEASGDVYLAAATGRLVASARGLSAVHDDAVAPEALTGADTSEVREFVSPDGLDALASVLPVGLLGWSAVVQQTTEEAYQPLVATLTRALMINVAFFLIFSVLASKIAAAIVRPIRALSDGARRISEGELDVEIPEEKARGEIQLLTRTFNDMIKQLRKNRKEIDASQSALQAQNEAFQRTNEMLSQLAITDGLTKLHNHRYFQDQLTRELKRLSRTGEPLAILLFDIDDFKKLNDNLGHAAGDEFLVRFASILNETVRETDLVARYGGEEFVVVAVGTNLEGAEVLSEKIRTAVAESSFLLGNAKRPSRVTVSIGVAQYAGSRKLLFQAADDALYRAKAAGKNCVIVADESECAPKGPDTKDELD